MTRFLQLPIFPVVLALYIPLNLYTQNVTLFALSDLLRPSILLALSAVLLNYVVWILVRSLPAAALITAGILAGIWVHGFDNLWRGAFVLVCIVVAVVAYRRPIGARAVLLLNVICLALIVQPAWGALSHELWARDPELGQLDRSPFSRLQLQESADGSKPPSIVHIVLDGYGGQDGLRTLMGFDNEPFLAGLRDLGFEVFGNARTPYNQTLLTMSSVFAGDYHEPGKAPLVEPSSQRLRTTLGRIIVDGPLQRTLADRGYRFLYTPTGYRFLEFPAGGIVDRPANEGITPFERYLVERLAKHFGSAFRFADSKLAYIERHNLLVKHALTTEFYKSVEPPYFLYHHILAPHPPFAVMADGSATFEWTDNFHGIADGDHATRGDGELQQAYMQGYLQKLQFVNLLVLDRARTLIEAVPSPKVIIIHGDHGSGALLRQDDIDLTCMAERMNTLLAVYSDSNAMRKSLTSIEGPVNLVNIYRALFDGYFGTSLTLLESRSHFAPWKDPQNPVRLTEDRLQTPCEAPLG